MKFWRLVGGCCSSYCLWVFCRVIKYCKSICMTRQRRRGSCRVISKFCYFITTYSAANTRTIVWSFQRAIWLREGSFSQLLSAANFSDMPMLVCPHHQFSVLGLGMSHVIGRPSASQVTLATDVVSGAIVLRSYIS